MKNFLKIPWTNEEESRVKSLQIKLEKSIKKNRKNIERGQIKNITNDALKSMSDYLVNDVVNSIVRSCCSSNSRYGVHCISLFIRPYPRSWTCY